MPRTRPSYPKSSAGRPSSTAQMLGQVVTPPEIALRMASELLAGRERDRVAILDPVLAKNPCPGQKPHPSSNCLGLEL